MSASLQTFPRNTPIPEILDAIEHDGAAIVEDMIAPDRLASLNRELDGAIATTPPGSRSGSTLWEAFHGSPTVRFTGLAARSPVFVELLEHEVLGAYADSALLPNAGSYWLNTGQAMIVGPGEQAQMLHRDMGNWPAFAAQGAAAPEVTVSSIFALSDFHEANGATRVTPGSHRWESFDVMDGKPEETIPAEMRAGSALLYSGKVVHGAGANRSDGWRRGLHLSFVLGWLRPEEASPLMIPFDLAKTFSPRVQQLLGYTSYDPAPILGGRLWLVDFEKAERMLGNGKMPSSS